MKGKQWKKRETKDELEEKLFLVQRGDRNILKQIGVYSISSTEEEHYL